MSKKAQGQTVREKTDQLQHQFESSLDHAAWGDPTVPFSTKPPELLSPDAFGKQLMKYIVGQTEADLSPFYAHLLSGELPKEGAKEWIKQLYFDARFFPTMIAQIVANANYHYDIRQRFGVNLSEELGEHNPEKEHPQLLKKVARALGCTDREIEFVKPLPEVLVYVEYRQKLVRDLPPLEGIAAGSLSNEATIVARYRKIITCLKNVYGLKEDDLEYFYIHSGGQSQLDYGGDFAHANEALEALKKYAVTADLQERCRQAVMRSLEARKVYQWGLYRSIILEKDARFQEIINGHINAYRRGSQKAS
jgi:pyrroloquinoline quinone (PQQ) biosynthesis protein C